MTGLRPVSEGDGIEALSADDWNRHSRATKVVEALQDSLGKKGLRNIRGDGIVRVKNNVGVDLGTYSILGIDEPLFLPRTYFDSWRQEVALVGVSPDMYVHGCKIAILAEPAVAGETVRAWVASLAPCRLDPTTVTADTDHADLIDGDTDYLQGSTTGYPIVWLDDTDDAGGFRWAVINLSACDEDIVRTIPAGECACCPGCACYPDVSTIVEDCGEIPCTYPNYQIIEDLPFSGETVLAHDAGCVWKSDEFDVITCQGTPQEVNWGPHYWQLTVSSTRFASTLELMVGGVGTGTGLAFTLKYWAAGFFDPLCSNEFEYEPDCTTMAALGFSPVRKICVKPVAAECVPCAPPTVDDPCCSLIGQTVPWTIYADFSVTCAALNGQRAELTYQGGGVWSGDLVLGCGTLPIQYNIYGTPGTCFQGLAVGTCYSEVNGYSCPWAPTVFAITTWLSGGVCTSCCPSGCSGSITITDV